MQQQPKIFLFFNLSLNSFSENLGDYMKMRFSTDWWQTVRFMRFLGFVTVGIDLYLLFCYQIAVLIPFSILFLLLCPIIVRKWLTVLHFREDGYQATLFGKHQCFISKNKPIYYYRFAAAGAPVKPKSELILISNEPIRCKQRWLYKVLRGRLDPLSDYRLDSEILIPYNEKTCPYLETSKWTECFLDL